MYLIILIVSRDHKFTRKRLNDASTDLDFLMNTLHVLSWAASVIPLCIMDSVIESKRFDKQRLNCN